MSRARNAYTNKIFVHTDRPNEDVVFFTSQTLLFLDICLGSGLKKTNTHTHKKKKDRKHPSWHGSKTKRAGLYRHPQALSAPILQTIWRSVRLVHLRSLWHGNCARRSLQSVLQVINKPLLVRLFTRNSSFFTLATISISKVTVFQIYVGRFRMQVVTCSSKE